MSEPVRVVTITTDELAAIVEAAVKRAFEAAQPDAPVEWIDTAEAAKLLRVHPRTVTRRAKDGTLPSTRVGGLLRFSRAAIDEHLRRAG